MHPRDCATPAKAGFFPGRCQALSPALALAMLLGWGLSAASFEVMLADNQASVPAQAVQATPPLKIEPAIAVNGTANTVPLARAWAGTTEAPRRTWPQRSERDVAGLEGSGCTAECLDTLRQRLLDHHRQAAPVWVF